jgi:hypothetical protein
MIKNSNSEDVYWTMKNGESISIDLMTRQHLINTLKRIVLNSERVQKLREDFRLNGEMAQDFNDSWNEHDPDWD